MVTLTGKSKTLGQLTEANREYAGEVKRIYLIEAYIRRVRTNMKYGFIDKSDGACLLAKLELEKQNTMDKCHATGRRVMLLKDRLMKLIELIPDKEVQAIMLARCVAGMEINEVARAFFWSRGTVCAYYKMGVDFLSKIDAV